MDEKRLLVWIRLHLLPIEGEVRAWLAGSIRDRSQIDDIVQEAYGKIIAAENLEGVQNPKAYFYASVRSVVIDHARREKIVRMEHMAEIEALPEPDDVYSPERIAAGRSQLRLVQRLIEKLPERCRKIVEMRKLHDLSQKEIARRLGVTEAIVENDTLRGLRTVLDELKKIEASQSGNKPAIRRKNA